MPATRFDRLRGISQGRIQPGSVTPPDGAHVFVLGEDQPEELSRLTDGDNTQITQIVDLTDYDFVNATMDTIGRPTGQHQDPPSWASDPSELFKFNFDIPGPVSQNLIVPPSESVGFTFDSLGPITYPVESYSSGNTYCRGIPSGTVVPAHLSGIHTPPVASPYSSLLQYTFQMWMNLDIDSHPSSSGVDFNLINFYGESGPNRWGINLSMIGLVGAGAHLWSPYLSHYDNTSSTGLNLDALYTISTNQGWQLITITFDAAESSLNRVTMYLDQTNLGHPSFGMATTPAIPNSGSALLQYGDMNCFGELDSCRLLDRVLSPSEVSTSLIETTTLPAVIDTEWVQQILIDDQVYAERTIVSGEQRRWTDFSAPVRRLTGQHEITFRMKFQEAA